MMKRPGYRYHRGKCIVEKPRVDPFKKIEQSLGSPKAVPSDPATDAAIVLLHQLYTELKEVRKDEFNYNVLLYICTVF